MAELSTKALRELIESPEVVDAVNEPCACGSQRVVSLGVDTMVCADKSCCFRVAAKLYAIVEKYGITDDITLRDLEYLCQDRFYRNWLDFFTDEWEDGEFEDIHSKLVAAIKSDMDVPYLALLAGFDVLSQDQLYNLCGDFQTATDLANALDSGGVLVVSERLGLNESHLLPAAVHIFNRLSGVLGDMLEAEEVFYSM